MQRKIQALITVTLLVAAIFLTVSVIPAFMIGVVYAEDGQPEDKIYPRLKDIMDNMKATDNITVFVHLNEVDADVTAEIEEATAPERQAMEEIENEKQRREQAAWEEFEKEFGVSAQELLSAKDSTAMNRYQEILEEYGSDLESRNLLNAEIHKLWLVKESKVSTIQEQRYPEIFARVKQAIEVLPDTKVIGVGEYWGPDTPLVRTNVGHINTLAKLSDVIGIEDRTSGSVYMSIHLYEIPESPWYPTLLSPSNGANGCTVDQPSFAWKTFKETTKYKFILATDAALFNVIKEAKVPNTSYVYDGTLDYRTNYFWRVMALEPAPSDWSATFAFQTEAAETEIQQPISKWKTFISLIKQKIRELWHR